MRDGLGSFIKDQSRDTDIFCFQEAASEAKALFKSIISDYQEITAYKYIAREEDFSQATYIAKNLKIMSSGPVLESQKNSGLGIYTLIQFGKANIHICNFHGLAHPGNKLDNPDRIRQSQGIVDFFKDKSGPKIIGGDFNILPDTKSIGMFEENGYRNLIKEFKIMTTRNQLAWERFYNNKQYYSDYIFLNPSAHIQSFRVPNIEISDHLPLILEVEP